MPEWTREQKRERVRNRVNKAYSPENHQYFPAKEDSSTVGWDDYLRVGIYVRVSTSDPMQTTSFELQQKYYDEMVAKHPHWTLVKIYADEGKSGVTVEHREQFQEMVQDALNTEKYLKLSEKICIKCGKLATRRSTHWICPYCDDCGPIHEKYVPIKGENDG